MVKDDRTDRNRPLYMISVAAQLAGVHPQTLRAYEQKGLVTPQRTSGNTRMYSQADIERRDEHHDEEEEGSIKRPSVFTLPNVNITRSYHLHVGIFIFRYERIVKHSTDNWKNQ